jgi:hypothetical protein
MKYAAAVKNANKTNAQAIMRHDAQGDDYRVYESAEYARSVWNGGMGWALYEREQPRAATYGQPAKKGGKFQRTAYRTAN